ncbi:hypothetical protein M8J76_011817 [Diaphorina citri]|nr:hypothetical protein M8J76_011817 [Diaphorina citri]
MFLSIIVGSTSPSKKECFTTSSRSNGCILEISSEYPKGKPGRPARFTIATFNCTSNLMAILEQNGMVVILDLLNEMYWQLPPFGYCSLIKFSEFSPRELMVCDANNTVLFFQVDEGVVLRKLKGHQHPVKFISSTSDNKFLMTSSLYETIIWDLEANMQKHRLFLGKKIAIKIIMAIGGVDTYITLFHLDSWTLYKRIPLPIQISHVKYLTFLNDKILIILTAPGELYFLDVELAAIKSSNYNASHSTSHIYSIASSPGSKHIACSLYSGVVLLFDTELLLNEKPCAQIKWRSPRKKKLQGAQAKEMRVVSQKISEVLDINRMRPLLKQFGEYPAKFRPLVWKTLLKIPHNTEAYKILASKPEHLAFKHLDKKYPLHNKCLLNALKRLLSCLANWNPLFSLVTYLPEFVFPFVVLLRNEPCALFEVIASIIVNYCQHWFQYFPFPPINTLALVENMLGDRDPALLDHYCKIGITSNVYAWLLLQSVFSEVLSEDQWLVLWDHLLTNEPWFLLLAVVAFNIHCRNVLLTLDNLDLVETFFHSQNTLDVHKLVRLAYDLDCTVSDDVHPRQYYRTITPLIPGPVYQPYEEYPKFVVDYQVRKLSEIREEEEKILKQETEAIDKKKNMEARMQDYLSEEVHAARIQELEDVYKNVLRKEEERVYNERLKLSKLKSELRKQEIDMLNATRAKIMKDRADRKHASLERLLDDIERKVSRPE